MIIGLPASKKSSSKNASRATGMLIVKKLLVVKNKAGPGLVFVEGGTLQWVK
jgi:hypothetical protein